jgi:hypothetical protein
MATWIAHLRLAENLLETIDGLEAASFALGNIAPDSGIPDEKWENFLHEHPDSLFYKVFLNCECDDDYGLDFMPVEGLRRQLDHIKTFYQDREKMDRALNERPDIYLTKPEMDRFVEDATRYLRRVYQLLWKEGLDVSGYVTVLDALPGLERKV